MCIGKKTGEQNQKRVQFFKNPKYEYKYMGKGSQAMAGEVGRVPKKNVRR